MLGDVQSFFPVPVLFFIKMYIFAGQLGYDVAMVEKLEGMAQFLLLLYTCAWFRAPVAGDAPANDLCLFQDLVRYRSVDSETTDAALGVMRRHVWYLRPSIVFF